MSTLITSRLQLNVQQKVVLILLFCFVCLAVSPAAVAGDAFADACVKVTGFFAKFETILRVASVSIVTIAIVFAGYQIAFAHKRLSDVAPVLIGGLLIGGAAALAGWFVGDWQDASHEGVTNQCGSNT